MASESKDASQRSEQYSRIEADQLPRPQAQLLQRRTQKTDDAKRIKRFLKIERQRG